MISSLFKESNLVYCLALPLSWFFHGWDSIWWFIPLCLSLSWFLRNYPPWLWDHRTPSWHAPGQSYLDFKQTSWRVLFRSTREPFWTRECQRSAVKEINDRFFWFLPNSVGGGNGTSLCQPEHLPLLNADTWREASHPSQAALHLFPSWYEESVHVGILLIFGCWTYEGL